MDNKNFDKIRILWIDDQDNVDGLPESTFPSAYNHYFEVTHPSRSGQTVFPYRTVSQFMDEFIKFWYRSDNEHPYFPVEIIAADYHLDKLSKSSIEETFDKSKLTLDDDIDEDENENEDIQNTSITEETHTDDIKKTYSTTQNDTNFDGLLAATFYATLTHKHPTSIVSITNYMASMPSGVHTLHQLSEPFLGVDFNNVLPDTFRSWEKIIHVGLKPLRTRIENLFEDHSISISADELLSLTQDKGEILTISSPFGTRRLPVQGLFSDITENDRPKKIKAWTQSLIDVLIESDILKEASQIRDSVWENGFSDENLRSKRERLSFLTMYEKDSEELEELNTFFGVTGKNRNAYCTKNIHDVFYKYNDRKPEVKRLASILLIFKYCKFNILEHIKAANQDQTPFGESHCKIDPGDLYSAIFPVPSFPVIDPFTAEKAIDTSHAWGRKMTRLHSKETEEPLGLNIRDVLQGLSNENKHNGLSMKEVQLLAGLFNNDSEIKHIWKDYPPAKTMLLDRLAKNQPRNPLS